MDPAHLDVRYPLLAGGLAFTWSPLVRAGSAVLLIGVILNAAQVTVIATAEAAATPPSCGSAR